MKLIKLLDFFILFIILIKVSFLLSAIGMAFAKHSDNIHIMLLEPRLKWLKERTEFIFLICMAILLIIYFRPGTNMVIDGQSRILFFLFGIILLFTANWELFIKESHWFKILAKIFGI
jgi:hypothetical protein